MSLTAIIIFIPNGTITSIDHSKFINNTGQVLQSVNTSIVSITHCGFVKIGVLTGSASSLVHLGGVIKTIMLSKSLNNRAGIAIVYILYYTTAENLTNNVFIDNNATYDVFITKFCRPGLSLSLGNPRCIPCPKHWYRNLIGIVIAAFIAGIALVVFMLVLNMIVAVGTLNGILFYAYIVAANADTYFWPFTAPGFVTVFISSLNLAISFNACFVETELSTTYAPRVYKALMQLTFPAYVTFLDIIVIVVNECSFKFAKIVGKGNPVTVLATMILLSYAKFFSAIYTSVSLSYYQPAYGSYNLDVMRQNNVLTDVAASLKATVYQKMHHFLEHYHALYTAKYRYWTGLLLFVRILLYLVSVVNECSFKFAKIVGKGNPVTVLATMILLSYAKFFSAIYTSVSLSYYQPAYGSYNLDVMRQNNVLTDVAASLKATVYQKMHHFLELSILQNIAIGLAYYYLYVYCCIWFQS